MIIHVVLLKINKKEMQLKTLGEGFRFSKILCIDKKWLLDNVLKLFSFIRKEY